MDDRFFFGVLIYLFVGVAFAGFMPDNFYTGTQHGGIDQDEFRDTINEQVDDIGSVTGQISFMGKILTFLFVTWQIDGMPTLLSIILIFVNLVSILVIGIYIYDKVRGIGS